jgi:hypothetical protein
MVKLKRYGIVAAIIACSLALAATGARPVMSQFLDVEDGAGDEPSKERPRKAEKSLPSHIARNVRAELMPGIKGAIRVKWETSSDSEDVFIVGRTSEVPYSPDKALTAKSIRMVEPGAERVAVDSDLPPGQYYYVVLAKDKIMDRSVELYPNVNYTTVPVVIEREIEQRPAERLPEKVTLIYAMVVNRNRVLVTWKGTQQPGISYNVYRSTAALATLERIRAAEKLAVLDSSKENFVDGSIPRTGNYFYAVTARDRAGNEDLQLVPDQSYTASGIFVALPRQNIVTSVRAKVVGADSVKIVWEARGAQGEGKYMLYRDRTPITSPEKVALAESIGSVDFGGREFTDKNLAPGSYYYAVLGRLNDGTLDPTFVRDANYTASPATIGGRRLPVSIRSEVINGKVSIYWNYSGKSGPPEYRIARVGAVVRSPEEIQESNYIATTSIINRKYVDRNPLPGEYYYTLVPAAKKNWGSYAIAEGVNITAKTTVGEPARQEQRVENGVQRDEKSRVVEEPFSDDSVNSVLRTTFFRARYDLAIYRLRRLVAGGLNDQEAAKARLFIGRSFIEKGEYRQALLYLHHRGVRTHYPEDSRFWSGYAISRLR